ncbi:MAG: ribonuclease HI [Deltaproteobacteria bacterium]|nr:MAG: ribonuclease HI [Deltaproteobacteria bacterium]
MAGPTKKYYAVAVGRHPGVYTQWFGETGAQAQVKGFNGARYKGFATIEEARAFVANHRASGNRASRRSAGSKRPISGASKTVTAAPNPSDRLVIYTDGSSLGNPGPGGYGTVIAFAEGDRELSGGYRRTTNNRMELLACIIGLEQLETDAAVTLYSDSRYVVDGIVKGWARRWKNNSWKKSNGEKAMNTDLWKRLLALCDRHDVNFIWIKGHAGNPGNERCDRLANHAAGQPDLPADKGFEFDRF